MGFSTIRAYRRDWGIPSTFPGTNRLKETVTKRLGESIVQRIFEYTFPDTDIARLRERIIG